MTIVEKEFLSFMRKFDANPFRITIGEHDYLIGEGTPLFHVTFHKTPINKGVTIFLQSLGKAKASTALPGLKELNKATRGEI